jgi:hypothetical protein
VSWSDDCMLNSVFPGNALQWLSTRCNGELVWVTCIKMRSAHHSTIVWVLWFCWCRRKRLNEEKSRSLSLFTNSCIFVHSFLYTWIKRAWCFDCEYQWLEDVLGYVWTDCKLLFWLIWIGSADSGDYTVGEQCRWCGETKDFAKDENNYLVDFFIIGWITSGKKMTSRAFNWCSIQTLFHQGTNFFESFCPSFSFSDHEKGVVLRLFLNYSCLEHVRCQWGWVLGIKMHWAK